MVHGSKDKPLVVVDSRESVRIADLTFSVILSGFLESFFTNPQYLIHVTKTDLDSGDGLCTVICACLQKYTRQKRQQLRVEQAEEYINLRLYRVGSEQEMPTDIEATSR